MPESTETETESSPETRPAIVDDLESRIAELEQLPEARFGTFTRLDWLFLLAGALLLPYLLLLWYWP
ncbi:MAG: hypothetical protein R3176_07940 [Woeseiaceae bacterium]|nr:hypothetical protein [Woeseiaceae bacterium]